MPTPITDRELEKIISEVLDEDISDGQCSIDHRPTDLGKIVTPEFIREYCENRALGMTRGDAARAIGITLNRLSFFLRGNGISKETHIALLEAEIIAEASFKKKCLVSMNTSAATEWRAALSLLEKRDEEFAPKQKINLTTDVQTKFGSADYEDMAKRAQDQLRKLRASRTVGRG